MSILWFLLVIVACGASAAVGAHATRRQKRNGHAVADTEDPRDTEIRELQAALKLAREDAERAERDRAAHQQALSEAQTRIAALSDESTAARQQYATCYDVLKREIGQKNDLRDEVDQLRRDLDTAKERAQELELELSMAQDATDVLPETVYRDLHGSNGAAPASPDVAVGTDTSPSLIQSLTQELDRWKRHCEVLGAELKQRREQIPARRSPGDADRDELQAIRGIGDVLTRKLHQLGIYRYRDLAALTRDDLKQASVLIPDLKARMRRYDWRDQARRLHQDKYAEPL